VWDKLVVGKHEWIGEEKAESSGIRLLHKAYFWMKIDLMTLVMAMRDGKNREIKSFSKAARKKGSSGSRVQ